VGDGVALGVQRRDVGVDDHGHGRIPSDAKEVFSTRAHALCGCSAMHHVCRVLEQILKGAQKTKAPMNGAFWG
ncbi:hypothetical protein, partial [Acidovorax sp. MR-S7]|uniref:hypothetical protein n=1 Tax=Acidovorax sp. MR-S7 TaxID=1268622 RepID=UPI001F2F6228